MAKNSPAAPGKTTINLAIRENKSISGPLALLLLLLIFLAACAVAKFAVVDVLARVASVKAAADGVEAQLEETQAYTAGYDALFDEYRRYSDDGMTDDELALADMTDAVALIDEEIAPAARVEDCAVSDNTVTLTLSGITLKDLSGLMTALKADARVASVSVSTAQSGSDEEVTATMTLTLAAAAQGGDAQ